MTRVKQPALFAATWVTTMKFDMHTLDKSRRYKILGACVTPRPIAWVCSQFAESILNVSSFSFFNTLGADPPTVVFGIVARPEGG